MVGLNQSAATWTTGIKEAAYDALNGYEKAFEDPVSSMSLFVHQLIVSHPSKWSPSMETTLQQY